MYHIFFNITVCGLRIFIWTVFMYNIIDTHTYALYSYSLQLQPKERSTAIKQPRTPLQLTAYSLQLTAYNP